MKHTLGPWAVQGNEGFVGTDEGDPQTICYMSDHRNRRQRSREESQANARLIAAAPQLLEACKEGLEIVELENYQGFWNDEIACMKAAIAAAEGE